MALVGAVPTSVPVSAALAATSTARVAVEFSPGNVVNRTVTFTEDSISGLEALQRAGFDVGVYSYAGEGAAVCSIDGVGHAPGPGCLKADAAWVYWRNGEYSLGGAGSTRVEDGDREGWVWGLQQDGPPAFAPPPTTPPATQPPPPPPAAPTTTAGPTGGGGPTGAGGSSGGGSSAGGGSPAGDDPAGDTAAPKRSTDPSTRSTTTTAASGEIIDPGAGGTAASEGDDDREEVAGQPLANTRAGGDGGGGGPLALAGFAVLLAAVIGLTVRARLARRGT